MNIRSLSGANNTKYSNPLNKNNKKNTSFSGHVLTKDEYGNNLYKFFLPNAPKGTKVLLTRLESDGKGNFVPSYDEQNGKKVYHAVEKELYGSIPTYSVYADNWNLDKDVILGYKFILPDNKEHFDNTAKAIVENPDKTTAVYTMATPLWTANSVNPRVMIHVIPDTFNVPNYTGAKRNHFNLMGGNLKTINEKIPYIKNAGYTAILSLPVFGNDNNSSHGYWTTNPYQITRNLGSVSDFKDLLINAYKNGIRWTADGAFVNEGISGIHVADFVTWGADSPLVDMFETKDLDLLPSRFGVFSKNPAVNRHAHIKLVNAPYKITYKKADNGTYEEASVKRVPYDSTKPSFIQVFDDRLASVEQMNDDSTFTVYDNQISNHNYEISNYRDSVQAYNRRVPVKEIIENFEKYKEAKKIDKDIEFKNYLMKWKNFEFVETNKDGGISLWVGNSDISKKQFVIPENSLSNDLSPELRLRKLAAQYQVQDDTVQVVEFWTGDVARTLTEYTAKAINEKIKNFNTQIDFETAIEQLIDEKAIPATAQNILEKTNGVSPLDNILSKDMWGENRNYKLPNIKIPQSITEGVMSYPFEAIEFSPDLTTVFSYPFVKNLAVTEDSVGLSRYEMFKMGDEYYNKMPQRYSDIYKKADELLSGTMTEKSQLIMQKLGDRLGVKFFDADNNLTTEGKEFYSLIFADISKFVVVSALAPKVTPNYSNLKNLDYDVNELGKITLNSLSLQYQVSPEDVAITLLNKLESGINNIAEAKIDGFVNYLSTRLKNVDSDSINVARLIIDATESGLDWRIDAAKDVGGYDAVYDGKYDFTDNENMIMGFWNKVNTAARKHNPRSYSIGELTDWGNFPKSVFAAKTNFSTTTDYESFYQDLLAFYGQNCEGNNIPSSEFANQMYAKLDKFLNTGYASNVNFVHRFVDNHDKPRAMHLLAMNMDKFKDDRAAAMRDVICEAMERTQEFNNLPQQHKDTLYRAVRTMSEGSVISDSIKYKYDNEKFGTVAFDFNIDAIVNQAIEENYEFKRFLNNPENLKSINKMKANTEHNMLRGAIEKMRAIWFAMAALPGTPTMFAGTELGMTGWETDSKNEHQDCRNALNWAKLDDPNYSYLRDFKRRLDDISKIRTKDGASALVNGTTIPIASPGHNAAAFYRYNDKTDAICVLHANGFDYHYQSKGKSVGVNRISLDGLPNGLEVGTIYVDALNPNSKYKVTNPYEIKKVDDFNTNIIQEHIDLGNAGLILLREKDFDGNEFTFQNS